MIRSTRKFKNGDKVKVTHPSVQTLNNGNGNMSGTVAYIDDPRVIAQRWNYPEMFDDYDVIVFPNETMNGAVLFTEDELSLVDDSVKFNTGGYYKAATAAPSSNPLLNFFKTPALNKCPICGASGHEMFLKFVCSSPTCQNYRR